MCARACVLPCTGCYLGCQNDLPSARTPDADPFLQATVPVVLVGSAADATPFSLVRGKLFDGGASAGVDAEGLSVPSTSADDVVDYGEATRICCRIRDKTWWLGVPDRTSASLLLPATGDGARPPRSRRHATNCEQLVLCSARSAAMHVAFAPVGLHVLWDIRRAASCVDALLLRSMVLRDYDIAHGAGVGATHAPLPTVEEESTVEREGTPGKAIGCRCCCGPANVTPVLYDGGVCYRRRVGVGVAMSAGRQAPEAVPDGEEAVERGRAEAGKPRGRTRGGAGGDAAGSRVLPPADVPVRPG